MIVVNNIVILSGRTNHWLKAPITSAEIANGSSRWVVAACAEKLPSE